MTAPTKEIEIRDYSGMIGHITITMVCYIFLALEQRCHDDPKTIGELFFACCDELDDISFEEALRRLLVLAQEKIRASGNFAESMISAMINAIMGNAIDFIKSGRRLNLNSTVTLTV